LAVGPVINPAARKRVLDYIDVGKSEGKLLTGGKSLDTPGHGYFIAPTVFTDVAPGARLAQEEIFGPVLAVLRSKNSMRRWPSPTTPSTDSPERSIPTRARSWTVPARSSRWATCTSTASARERWWARIRSAASR
jgi:hypothetical protein